MLKTIGSSGVPTHPSSKIGRGTSSLSRMSCSAEVPGPLPDNAGQITHLALQYGNVEYERPLPHVSGRALLGMYQTLFREMEPNTRFTVVCARPLEAEQVRDAATRSDMVDPARVETVVLNRDISVWIRDSMIPVRSENGRYELLVQHRAYRVAADDNAVAVAIAARSPLHRAVVRPELCLDGGNLVTTPTVAYVGVDSINETAAQLSTASGAHDRTMGFWRDQVPALFEQAFHRKLFVLHRDGHQGAFHIDMMMTPMADGSAVQVGDPRLALEALRELSSSEYSAQNRVLSRLTHGDDASVDVLGPLIQANDDDATQARFDNAARELADGHAVERLPYLNGLRNTWKVPYVTYNNCLQEDFKRADGTAVRRVFLPQYGIECLDHAAMAAYRRHGYHIVALPLAALTRLEGAVRCSAYPIERASSTASARVDT